MYSHLCRINDLSVRYATAAIEIEDPFAERDINGIEMCVCLFKVVI